MTRREFEKHILETYGIEPDFPWQDKPNAVFRHPLGKKWFALVMDIPKSRLGEKDESVVDVVNLKCPPSLVSSFCQDNGIYHAYHMNKANWISVVLADADEDEIKTLTDISFNLTIKNSQQTKSKTKIKVRYENFLSRNKRKRH